MLTREKEEMLRKDIVRRGLGNTTPAMRDIDGLMFKAEGKPIIFELLKCDEKQWVTPYTSDPSRYWDRNKYKFAQLWNAAKAADAWLVLVNYAESGTKNADMVKTIIVKDMDEEGLIRGGRQYERYWTREEFSRWVQSVSAKTGIQRDREPEDFTLKSTDCRQNAAKIKGAYPVKADLSGMRFLEEMAGDKPNPITDIDEMIDNPDGTVTIFSYVRDEAPLNMKLNDHFKENALSLQNAFKLKERMGGNLYLVGISEKTDDVKLYDISDVDESGMEAKSVRTFKGGEYGDFLKKLNNEARTEGKDVIGKLYDDKDVSEIKFKKGKYAGYTIEEVAGFDREYLQRPEEYPVASKIYLKEYEKSIDKEPAMELA